MPEWLPVALKWGFAALALSPIWGALIWSVWAGLIHPRLIPHQDVQRMADELVARYGDEAEEIALIEEDRAWRRVEPFEQGKWMRVRRALRRR